MPTTPPPDNRGVLDKLKAGDVGALDLGDAATAAKFVRDTTNNIAPFVPSVGNALADSTPVGLGLNGVIAYYENKDKQAEIAHEFDPKNIRQLIRQNPKLADKFEKKFDLLNFLGHAGASLGGAALGGGATFLLTTFINSAFPIVFPLIFAGMSLVGAAIGGTIANSMYSSAFEKQEQDPVVINMQINKIHAKNGFVPPEIIFAALASNLPEKLGKKVDDRLKEYTGTAIFTEALSDHNNIPKLRAMMNDPYIDNLIRAQVGMVHDPLNPLKTVAEQYADMINSGKMNPQNLLQRNAGIHVLRDMAREQGQEVDVPVTPGKQNYISKT